MTYFMLYLVLHNAQFWFDASADEIIFIALECSCTIVCIYKCNGHKSVYNYSLEISLLINYEMTGIMLVI